MNTDTKWEAVNAADLNDGDKVRIVHDNGDVINGTWMHQFGTPGMWSDTADGSWDASYERKGYSFERAVPERTLPTEPGIYTLRSHLPISSYVVARGSDGRWWDDRREPLDERDVPDDLVRLAPVTEAEELRKRIDKAREYVADPANWGTFDGRRKLILRLLDGEASNV